MERVMDGESDYPETDIRGNVQLRLTLALTCKCYTAIAYGKIENIVNGGCFKISLSRKPWERGVECIHRLLHRVSSLADMPTVLVVLLLPFC